MMGTTIESDWECSQLKERIKQLTEENARLKGKVDEMTVKLTNKTIETILEGVAKMEQFERIDGETFIKFDSFTISSSNVTFSYKGVKNFYLDHSAQIDRGENLTVEGIEGKMGVRVTL